MPKPSKKKKAPKNVAVKRAATKPKGNSAFRTRSNAPVTDFTAAFSGLKQMMAAFLTDLRVTDDEPRKFTLVTKANSWRGGPMFFSSVMMGKAYVSYHLLALYMCPEMVKAVSPGLKKRMQGKACFNFKAPDAVLFAELGELSRAGLEKYRAKKWL
jgi:hypothetical protein